MYVTLLVKGKHSTKFNLVGEFASMLNVLLSCFGVSEYEYEKPVLHVQSGWFPFVTRGDKLYWLTVHPNSAWSRGKLDNSANLAYVCDRGRCLVNHFHSIVDELQTFSYSNEGERSLRQ